MPFETLQCSGPGSGLQKLIERQGQLSSLRYIPYVRASWHLGVHLCRYKGWAMEAGRTVGERLKNQQVK